MKALVTGGGGFIGSHLTRRLLKLGANVSVLVKYKSIIDNVGVFDKDKKEVTLDQANFGVSEENDPRLVANDIFMSEDKSDLSMAVLTVCKKREGNKCIGDSFPWP